MEKLLLQYSGTQIILFVLGLTIAIKEFVSIYDWGKDRLKKCFSRDFQELNERKEVEARVAKLNQLCEDMRRVNETFIKIDDTFKAVNTRMEMLVASDKEAIKSYITDKHHYFVYDQGWIDDYSIECLERRFAAYRQEQGNSFVEGLMYEIRKLPKKPPEPAREQYSSTAEYVQKAKAKHHH